MSFFLFLLVLVVLGTLGYRLTSPAERERYLGRAMVVVRRMKLAMDEPGPEYEAFRHALRARTRHALVTPVIAAINVAVFFGMQSLQAYAVFGWMAKLYRDAGFTATDAGLLLGLITGIGIPLSFAIPTLSTRPRAQLPMLAVLTGCYLVGYLGLLFAPSEGAWLWALLVGVGTCTFPLILTLIGLRARTPAGTAALSGFTQSVGYLIGATGPFAIGLLHDLTDGWTVPLLVLIALLVPLVVAGVIACRSGPLEDQLRQPSTPA